MAGASGRDRGHGSRDRRDDRLAPEGRHLTTAVDTNVIVRLLVRDDPHQAAVARTVLATDFTLLASVALEVEWVLRSCYDWPRKRIAAAFAEIADLPTLHDAPTGFAWAVDRFAAGADFADMLHVAAAPPAERFATFDRRIAAAVGSDAPIPIETLA